MGTQRAKGEPIVQAPASPEVLRAAMAGRDVPCTHCGYNLRDCASDKCPECGCGLRVIVEADRLFRRAWVIPVMLGITALGFALNAWVEWKRANWASTWMLMPVTGNNAVGINPTVTMIRTSWVRTAWNFAPTVVSAAVAVAALIGVWQTSRAIARHSRVDLARGYAIALRLCAVVGASLIVYGTYALWYG